MDAFGLYLRLGFEHISDLAGYDHILFLIALCALYRIEQWRALLILVTAFTIGHSITLALAALGTVSIQSEIIEFLIPTTIFLTAIYNVFHESRPQVDVKMGKTYAMALFFGFIHGMGFSNYFRALLMGKGSVAMPLLAFNLGIELGQLLVVASIVGASVFVIKVLRFEHRDWTLFVSGAAAGLSLLLMTQTKFW